MSEPSPAVDVPTLGRDDLAVELEQLHRKEHRSFNTLVLARMSPHLDALDVKTHKGLVTFHVETARSELELRAALPAALDEPPVVVLLDWDPGRLPADVAGRVATGRHQTIARARRLRAVFSNAQLSAEVEQCRPLADALLREPGLKAPVPPGGIVTLDEAWRAWLVARKAFGVPGEREVTLLLRFARAAPPDGLRGLLAARPELGAALDGWLRDAIGPVARRSFRLWLDGHGLTAAALAFVLDGARASLGAQDFLDGALSARLAELSPALADEAARDPKLLASWADLADLLAAQCENDAALLQRVLDAADAFLPARDALAQALAGSRYLRVALDRRKANLADALRRAAGSPDDASWRSAVAALEALGQHRSRAIDAGHAALYERALMATRLVGWLAARGRDEAFSATESDALVLSVRAEDFVRQGAFADSARRVARGSEAEPLGAAVQAVVARADAVRDADDAAFGERLVRWCELGRPADRVVPIEGALDRFAVRFLKEDPARKLLVLLLDGMSWDRAVELLESLEAARYAPLRWRASPHDAGLAPVVAALPTITDVSRAAFFAGHLLRPGDPLDTSRDPLRLENHKGLRALGLKAPLLLKRDLQTQAGDASPDALELVRRGDRLVALVINAIDDQLKAGAQTRVAHTLDTIRPLRDLLEQATLANRAVLLVADHGHIAAARMARVPRATDDVSGTRWRAHRAQDAAHAGEVVLTGPSVWRPPGVEKVALLARETETYGLASTAGEHGGATLAEVVAPAILVAHESLAERMRTVNERETVDGAMEVQPLARPAWWGLRPESAARAPAQGRRPARVEAAPVQPALPTMAAELRPEAPAAAAPVAAKESPWAAFFAKSKALQGSGQRVDPRFVAAVAALDAEGGVLSVERLGAEVGVMPSRVEGMVERMREVFNADGTQVVRFDAAARTVRLDVAALKEIFG
ncbi:MAG: BREX-2 system phosphatase PglZ [Polyangiales bacterium]